MIRENIIKEIEREREQESIRSKQRLNTLEVEIDKWPKWKKDCNLWIIIKKDKDNEE